MSPSAEDVTCDLHFSRPGTGCGCATHSGDAQWQGPVSAEKWHGRGERRERCQIEVLLCPALSAPLVHGTLPSHRPKPLRFRAARPCATLKDQIRFFAGSTCLTLMSSCRHRFGDTVSLGLNPHTRSPSGTSRSPSYPRKAISSLQTHAYSSRQTKRSKSPCTIPREGSWLLYVLMYFELRDPPALRNLVSTCTSSRGKTWDLLQT